MISNVCIILTGQTPIELAEDNDEMILFLKSYQHDIQYTGPNTTPWRFDGAWHKSGE